MRFVSLCRQCRVRRTVALSPALADAVDAFRQHRVRVRSPARSSALARRTPHEWRKGRRARQRLRPPGRDAVRRVTLSRRNRILVAGSDPFAAPSPHGRSPVLRIRVARPARIGYEWICSIPERDCGLPMREFTGPVGGTTGPGRGPYTDPWLVRFTGVCLLTGGREAPNDPASNRKSARRTEREVPLRLSSSPTC